VANIKISELSNAGALNGTEVLPIVQGNATVKTTTQSIVNLLGINYTPENVANKSTDTALSQNSDTLYPSQRAIKTYVDSTVVSAITDNGNWDASGGFFPNVNAQNQPIQKGDLWYISVAGTLGGNSVLPGYSIRALVNNPAQNATNWGIINVGYGFTPENVANKSANTSLGTSDTLYPTQNAVKTYVTNALSSVSAPNLQAVTSAGATTTSNIQVGQVSTTAGSSLQSSGDLLAKNIVLRPTLGSATNQLTLDSSLITGSRTYTLPNATGTIALLSSISATSPISYNSGTGVISMPQASGSQNGFLSSTDWTAFNGKQNALSGSGVVKSTSGTISYISGTSSQFIKGDGSLDSNTYVSSSALLNYLPLNGGVMTGDITFGSQLGAFAYSITLSSLQPSSSSYNKISLIAEGFNSELGYMQIPDGASSSFTPSLKMTTNGGTPDVIISNWGFQLPRLTDSQRASISGSFLAPGLMVYQTNAGIDGEGVYVYNGSTWQKLAWYTP
jgi:hypothetical protein